MTTERTAIKRAIGIADTADNDLIDGHDELAIVALANASEQIELAIRILRQHMARTVHFRAGNDRPGCRACGVMVRTVGATGAAMALAARGGQKQVMARHLSPVGLVQVLAGVDGFRVVAGVAINSCRPVVCGPGHPYAGHLRACRESAGACE